jgi:5-methylcytosine-specific restriction endonuclease McrA
MDRNLCNYGCGRIAKYKFANGKFCCSKNIAKCPAIKKQRSISHRNFFKNEETEDKEKRIEKHKIIWSKERKEEARKKSIIQWQNPEHKKLQSKIKKEYYRNESNQKKKQRYKKIKNGWTIDKKKQARINRLLTSEVIKKRYPFFAKVEEIKDGPNPGEYFVHCKNHNCNKSKEKNGWFLTSYRKIYERIRALENPNGNDGQYLYCSNECKYNCILWNIKKDPLKTKSKCYSYSEYQTFRKFVLERDNYECQFCGKKATDVHHERPQKLEPFFALDPDFAWSCCEKCHYEKGHPKGTECSIGNIIKE